MLRISEKAALKLKEILAENPGKTISVVIDGFGWGGPKLGLALEEPRENHKLHDIGGIGLSISAGVLPYTTGKEIDYRTKYGNEGFLFNSVFGHGC